MTLSLYRSGNSLARHSVFALSLIAAATGFTARAAAQDAAPQADTVTTRTVRGTESATGAEVRINQIETARYPKVTVYATVLRGGAPVTGLTDKDFRVREDEVDQSPLTVQQKLTPLSVTVVLDTSGSIKGALGQVQQAAGQFVDALAAQDEVSAIGFAREVRILSASTTDHAAVKSAISATVARGDTALYDALYSAVSAYKGKAGRKAIVLLTDGVDDDGYGKQLSKHSLDEALALSKEVNVPVFALGLGAELDETILQRVASSTGAKYFHAPTAKELSEIYGNIGRELSGQYTIDYTSNLPADGTVHRIQFAFGGQVNVKEYQAPGSATTAVQATAPAPTAAPSSTREVVRVRVGLGRLVLKDCSNCDLTIHKNEGAYVDTLGSRKTSIDLPVGDYQLRSNSARSQAIHIEDGKTVEFQLAAVKVTSPGNFEVTVSDSDNSYATTLRGKQGSAARFEIFPGQFVVRTNSVRSAPVTLQAGQTTEFALGTLEVTAPQNFEFTISDVANNYADTLRGKPTAYVSLIPGKYQLRQNSVHSDPVTVEAATVTRVTVGQLTVESKRDFDVTVYSSGNNYAATLHKRTPTVAVPPGKYQLRFGASMSGASQEVNVEAGKEVVVEAATSDIQ